jgi:hypothetical protein
MVLIISSAGIQVVVFILMSPAKFIDVQSAAGTANWCWYFNTTDRFIEIMTLLACSVI